MNRLAIIGAGDLGLQLAHLAGMTGQYSLAGFFDDTRDAGDLVAGSVVRGGVSAIPDRYAQGEFDSLVIAIGYRHLRARQAMYERFAGQVPFARLVHPRALIDPTSTIGEGAVIFTGCVLDMGATIGANVLLNAGCVIGHHSEIASGCFLSPAVSIAGFVTVEPGCVLGIGTIVIDNIRITGGTRTGAGAVVTRSIGQPGLYLGIPARFAKDTPDA
jgi:sugar O-acyltransferase (sialic acid O-acetyltransferase NeuD family)